MIETVPVIHIFHQVIEELTFFTKIGDPNSRSCHSEVIFGNLETSLGKYRAEDYCPEGRSTKTSTANCLLISCMPFLQYIYILPLETEKTHIFKNMLLIIQKNDSQIMNFLEQSEDTISGFLLWDTL